MTFPPYFVPWAFGGAIVLLLAVGLIWLVFNEVVARVVRRGLPSDLIFLWLAFAALFQSLRNLRAAQPESTADASGLWILWGTLAVYLGLRVMPRLTRREPVLLAVGLAAWGWNIGAGIQYIGEMEVEAGTVSHRPEEILRPSGPTLAPLQRALQFSGLAEAKKKYLAELLGDLRRGGDLPPGRASLARVVLFPELAALYRLEIRRLWGYEALQVLLLVALMIAWGFGASPRP